MKIKFYTGQLTCTGWPLLTGTFDWLKDDDKDKDDEKYSDNDKDKDSDNVKDEGCLEADLSKSPGEGEKGI